MAGQEQAVDNIIRPSMQPPDMSQDWVQKILARQCCSLQSMVFLLIVLVLVFFGYGCLNLKSQNHLHMPIRELHGPQSIRSAKVTYPQPDLLIPSRNDVLVLTKWLAPIVWEGTFNIDLLNKQFQLQNATIGLTVFAIKRYIDHLKLFLESAEMYFMVGHRVNYYVFTDQPKFVPQIVHRERKVVIIRVDSYHHMYRMEMISSLSKERFFREVDYLVCADVNIRFKYYVGVEILSSLFGTLHLAFSYLSRITFPYERRSQSQAYISEMEGDFYYTGNLFGGSVMEVYRLTKACHEAMIVDKANHIKVRWQDESYLNKYLLHHKPTKVLSLEYMYSYEILAQMSSKDQDFLTTIIRRIRILDWPQNYQLMQSNQSFPP